MVSVEPAWQVYAVFRVAFSATFGPISTLYENSCIELKNLMIVSVYHVQRPQVRYGLLYHSLRLNLLFHYAVKSNSTMSKV